ncbi:putative sensor domain DACNV-containing protein [Nitratireductor sp. XY-223]|uniref:putative sensor domain DACNV-containing protein n=1 Tax=Nitratireductor sp. XY-223 TaxID=2561926 RepID=UPI0010A996B4|nr:hypothetical protein [Nitratireductor sp. XY-223]
MERDLQNSPEEMAKYTKLLLDSKTTSPVVFQPNLSEHLGRVISSRFSDDSYNIEAEIYSEFSKSVESAYFASFELDEGRFFPFSISYVPQSEIGATETLFDQPLELSAKSVSKLAPALVSSRRNIIISYINEKNFIVGIGVKTNKFLELSSIRPGTLSVKYYVENQIGPYNLAFLGRNDVYFNPGILTDHLGALVSHDKGGFNAARAEFAFEVLRRIYSFQRGGILIIVDEQEDWAQSISSGNLFDMNSQMEFGKLSESLVGRDIDAAISTGYSNDVASLSRVDGATIVDRDFRVLAFGAKLKAKSAKYSVHRYTEFPPGLQHGSVNWGTPGKPKPISEVGGMRHRSSAQFIHDNKNALALTISEDGPISWFFWHKPRNMVARIKNAEAFIV